ncbi:hypothetical protein EPO14_04105 [Patescibacteria group bacterium]|nr:MAG: hypothetical protein EPO14_04105 [Patescibacteria group bacterium]
MEKVSFWDEFWGRKASGQKNTEWNESPPDGSLREMISERRTIYDKTRDARGAGRDEENRKEKRKKEEEEQRRVAEACLNASNTLEDFLASAYENILEATEKGHHSVMAEVSIWDLPKDTLMNLKAFKDLKTFCSKYGLKLHYSDNSRTEYLDWEFPSWRTPPTNHIISILF